MARHNHWLNSTVQAYYRRFAKQPTATIWEVGSRDGHDGDFLGRMIASDYRVVAFEPNPDQAAVIRRNYPGMVVYELAASDVDGVADFMVYEGSEGDVGSSSLNLGWKGDDLAGHVIKVKTVRLDGVLGDETVDIMKIDVEGHSLQVLHGLGDKLSQVKVLHVETETWTGSDHAVIDYLSSRGWILCDVQEEWGGMPDQVWANSLFPTR
jgi:FkbM family methyltransferase